MDMKMILLSTSPFFPSSSSSSRLSFFIFAFLFHILYVLLLPLMSFPFPYILPYNFHFLQTLGAPHRFFFFSHFFIYNFFLFSFRQSLFLVPLLLLQILSSASLYLCIEQVFCVSLYSYLDITSLVSPSLLFISTFFLFLMGFRFVFFCGFFLLFLQLLRHVEF